VKILANIDNIKSSDTIIVANNRQVLALKRQLSLKSFLPKILTWNNFLIQLWEQNENYFDKNLIDSQISYHIFENIIKSSDIKFSKTIVNEVWTNYSWFKKQMIVASAITVQNQMQEYFLNWVEKYQNWKDRYNLIDVFDLPEIIKAKNDNYYSYGFKALTKQQQELFAKINIKKLKIEELKIKQEERKFEAKTFATFEDELKTCLNWAKDLREQNPEKSIAIIVPELEKNAWHFENGFNEIFAEHTTQTKEKSFNTSLGKPLTEFNIVRDLLLVLEVNLEILENKISTENLLKLFNSRYIFDKNFKTSNKILKLEKDFINKDKLLEIVEIDIVDAKSIKLDKKHNYNKWLEVFNTILNFWNFNAKNKMTSDEYQIWNKYKTSSLTFNKLAIFNKQISFKSAFYEFKTILEKVIFSPQSGKNQIQIMGMLEAEGLQFDNSWAFGVNSKTLPFSLNPLRFIPLDICQKFGVPRCDYGHIKVDSLSSIKYLSLNSNSPIISFSKLYLDENQIGSSLVFWDKDVEKLAEKIIQPVKKLKIIQDNNCKKLADTQINKAIKTLKDQNLCEFRGFANRLKIDDFNNETIGINSMEKGNILHKSLEKIYLEITNKTALENLQNQDEFIKNKITESMIEYKKDGFYNVVFKYTFNKIVKFLELEKTRDNWEIIAVEKIQKTKLSKLSFNTKIDRIDKNDSGAKIIFDYKSGKATASNWCKNIKEPQLPIYALNGEFDAISFVSFKDKVGYSGMAENEYILPKSRNKSKPCDKNTWQEQQELWREKLEAIADDFTNGKASVNPKKSSCDYCNLQSFCKIEKTI
jgi:ATP-dependent helicase/nuclease subunit B